MNQSLPPQPNMPPAPGSWTACYEPSPTVQEMEPPPLADVLRNPLVRRGRVRTVQEVRDVIRLRHPIVIPILIRALNDGMLNTEAREGLRVLGEPAYRCLMLAAQNHKNKRERLQAIIALRDWSDSRAVPILLAAIRAEHREVIWEKGLYWSAVAVVGAICAAFVVVVCALARDTSGVFVGGWGEFSLGKQSYSSEVRLAAMESLAHIGDPRAISALIPMMHTADFALSSKALSSLLRIVPKVGTMRMEQAHLLPAETVPQLTTLIEAPNYTLARYALEALHAIGDGRALPCVMRLATQPPTYNPEKHALREYARFLVPILRERAQQDTLRQTLLRGATCPASPNELLRPVSGKSHPDHASSELLRPISTQAE